MRRKKVRQSEENEEDGREVSMEGETGGMTA